jgi:hypothetical protein
MRGGARRALNSGMDVKKGDESSLVALLLCQRNYAVALLSLLLLRAALFL